jgi:hypothetical protein
VLLVNETTRVPVIVPAKPLATLAKRAPAAIVRFLLELGLESDAVHAEFNEMEEVVYAKTESRSVLGSINELTRHLEVLHESRLGDAEHKLSLLLGDTLITVPPFGVEYPAEVVQRVFDTSRQDVGTSPTPPSRDTHAESRMVARVFQVRVVLNGIEPPIWRRIHVRSDVTLDIFHRILQIVMGWTGTHLHEYLIGRERIGPMELAPDLFTARECARRLGRVVHAPGDRLHYLYDQGDNWSHDIVLERVLEQEAGVGYPCVVEGARACPPEDCGGPQGYEELLEAIADTGHPEHANTQSLVGEGFDPEAFDSQAVNAALVAERLVHPTPNPGSGRPGARPALRLVR